jgi:hypothetical protein
MLLIRLGRGTQWTVYAATEANGSCPVLDLIAELDEKRANKVLSDLQQFVPNSTRRDWIAMDFSWQLEGCDAILEFRWPTKKGGTPRVLWFYDRGQVIICTHGVNKKGNLSNEELRRAEAVRTAYLAACAGETLTIVDIDEYEAGNQE